MDSSTLYIWISIACMLIFFLNLTRNNFFNDKLPPGPLCLPVVGNLLQLSNKPHASLAKLANIHGSLMTVKFGNQTTIVVSSADMAQEVLKKHDQSFCGRTVPDAVRVSGHHEASMVWSQRSPHWRALRKLCATQMFTTQRLNVTEEIRLKQLKDLMDYVRDNANARQAINVGQTVFSTVLNIVSNTIFSMNLGSYKSETGENFKAIVWAILQETGRANVVDFFPFLRPFDPLGVRNLTTTYFGKLDKIFDTIISQRLDCQEQHAPNHDLLSVLLQHKQENGSTLSPTDIKSLLKDLFIAGTDTSSNTLEWAMTELLRNRDILSKAKLELRENLSKNKVIEESDIARMPYLRAIVKETFRLHPPTPLLIPHRAEIDVHVSGFNVPRDAQVLVNAWAIGRNPEIWANPTSFRPERFLESNIDFRGRHFELIPFGSGRRICPGLPLAYRMVHLILGSLLHSFDWELEGEMKPTDIDMEEKFGLSLQKAKPLFAVPILH